MMASPCFQPKLGDLVNVASRHWPGINKPGGVGKIAKINNTTDIFSIDVVYMLGGQEKEVELEFVQEHKFDEENNGRPGRRRRSAAAVEETPKLSQESTKKIVKKQSKPKPSKKKTALKDASSKANSKSGKKHQLVDSKAEKPKKSKKAKIAPLVEGNSTIEKKKSIGKKQKKPTNKGDNTRTEKISLAKNTKTIVKTQKPNKKRAPATKPATMEQDPSSLAEATASGSGSGTSWRKGFVKNAYTTISNKASTFVQEIIGKDSPQPSSPESTASSLDLKVENE